MSRPYTPTPQQLALANERKAKRLAIAASPAPPPAPAARILVRPWLTVAQPAPARSHIRLMTWNMLAQCLIRRELFPGSDCLKIKDREHMLVREILQYDADVLCLQEVDRLESLLPPLSSTYDHIYASAPGKLHGCMILYRKGLLHPLSSKVVFYDDESVTTETETPAERRGSTRRTRNIGLIAALAFDNANASGLASGCLIATTHLFWHPRYTYERIRQSIILIREVNRFRSDMQLSSWPAFLAGDFNSQPQEATYALLVGESLTEDHHRDVGQSSVIHISIDPTVEVVDPSLAQRPTKGEEDEDGDPDRVITNCRPAGDPDGLLSTSALESLCRDLLKVPLRSAYDEGLRSIAFTDTFGARQPLAGKGRFEPVWTSFTPLWRLTLDYIFIMDRQPAANGAAKPANILALLTPHKTNDLEPGLPRQTICASDHVALAAELEF